MGYILRNSCFLIVLISFFSNTFSSSKQIIQSARACTNYLLHIMKSGAHIPAPHNKTKTWLEYSLQSADSMRTCNSQKSAVLTALFHEIGYLTPYQLPYPPEDEILEDPTITGSNLLKALGFSSDITVPIKQLSEARRYAGIAKNSIPMTQQEKIHFEQSPYFNTLIALLYCNLKSSLLPASKNSLFYYQRPIETYLINRYTLLPQLTNLPLVAYLQKEPVIKK